MMLSKDEIIDALYEAIDLYHKHKWGLPSDVVEGKINTLHDIIGMFTVVGPKADTELKKKADTRIFSGYNIERTAEVVQEHAELGFVIRDTLVTNNNQLVVIMERGVENVTD